MNDDQRIAERAAQALFDGDRASQMLGMTIESCAPGQATVSMRIRPDMVNGHRICHGGLIFALADSAFAFACNSHGDNTVAAGAAIEFLAPGREGTCSARSRRSAGARARRASTKSRSATSATRPSRFFAGAATRSRGD